jgi:Outer membrane protein beta-barrel domain
MKFRVGAILVAAAMFAGASPTYAQNVNMGVKVGVNFADLSIDGPDVEDVEFDELLGNKTGFVAGAYIEVPVSPALSFAPEVLFTQKGAKAEFGDADFSLEATQLQVPILLKANFSSSSVRPFVAVGPAFGFNTSAKQKAGDVEVDIDDEIEPVEFSVVFGGGVKFGQASIEARYDLGLNNLSSSEVGSIKSRTFSVLFGFGWSN